MSRFTRPVVAGLVLVLLLFPAFNARGAPSVTAGLPSGIADLEDLHAKLADVDLRTSWLQPTAQQISAVSALRAHATWNRFGTPQSLINFSGYLATGLSGDAATAARSWIRSNRALYKLSEQGVTNLDLVNDTTLSGTQAHVVLFRQRFGRLTAAQDGMITVGIVAGRVVYASSSVAGDAPTPVPATISPVTAWLAAAANIGRVIPANRLSGIKVLDGWTVFNVVGFAQPQRVRLRAFPIAAGSVRPVFEANVVHVKGADVMAYTTLVDAQSRKVLWRQNRVQSLAHEASAGATATNTVSGKPAQAPVVTSFQGTYKDAPAAPTCGPTHPFPVPAGTTKIAVVATATVPANDIKILLLSPSNTILATADTATSPEAIVYTPQGGIPAGTYRVQVCPYDAPTVPAQAPYTYTGTAITDNTPIPNVQAYPPKWKFFTSNPPLTYANTDARILGCWESAISGTAIPGCRLTLRNTAARAPWDYAVQANAPSMTTIGNAANSSQAWLSPLTPAEQYRPVSATRTYNFPWTNQWYTSKCSPTAFTSTQRNDIDAAVTNLFAMHNRMHDWSYHLGFTEQNYNAQQNNFGNEDRSPDREADPETGNAMAGAVSGGAPSYLGRDNANQITLQDGVAPHHQYVSVAANRRCILCPCVDGDYDMSIIGHEYTHLISNRMVGGPDSVLTGHQAGSMGESWSDLTAVEYLHEYGYVPTRVATFVVGAYVTQNNTRGIRNYNLSDNPLNYSNVGYDIPGPEVHADAEIWDGTNFHIRRSLASRYNAQYPATDAALQRACADGRRDVATCPGNRRWMQIVFDAFLLMQPAVSMLDARDAYLAADRLRFNGANQNLLWQAFALKGMGVGASSNGSDDTDPRPSFDSPLSTSEPLITFKPVRLDNGNVAIANAQIYVGRYEARSTPIADTDGRTPLGPSARLYPGTYDFTIQTPVFGVRSFKATVAAGQNQTLQIGLLTNLASRSAGATIAGNGATTGTSNRDYNLQHLIRRYGGDHLVASGSAGRRWHR